MKLGSSSFRLRYSRPSFERLDHAAPISALCGAPHNTEIGAGWAKRSAEGRDYISLKIDDPSLPAPLFAGLFAEEDGRTHSVIWTRSTASSGRSKGRSNDRSGRD